MIKKVTHKPVSRLVGVCPFCHREMNLTHHHLIPKKMHRRNLFKRKYNRSILAETILICRQCHDGIHRFYDEMELAKKFNSFILLQKDKKLAAYFNWVAKQRRRID